MIDLSEYEEIDTINDYEFMIGDIIYHPPDKSIQLIIAEDTDLIQEEAYPMIANFGCLLLRKKSN
jgi:hypothetical protein